MSVLRLHGSCGGRQAVLDSLCKRLSSDLFDVRRVKNISRAEAFKITYSSLFESHLRYGIVLWGTTSNNNLTQVIIIQKQAVIMLAGPEWQDSCREDFKDLKILTVAYIYIMDVICLAASASGKVYRNLNVHTHNKRNAQDFSLPVHHNTRFKRKPN